MKELFKQERTIDLTLKEFNEPFLPALARFRPTVVTRIEEIRFQRGVFGKLNMRVHATPCLRYIPIYEPLWDGWKVVLPTMNPCELLEIEVEDLQDTHGQPPHACSFAVPLHRNASSRNARPHIVTLRLTELVEVPESK